MKKLVHLLLALLLLLLAGGWWFYTARQGIDTQLAHGTSEFGGKALVLSLPVGTRVLLLNNLRGDSRLLGSILSKAQKRGCFAKDGALADNCIMLITGNALSATGDDTSILTTIASLIERNPYRIFYLYGTTEKQRSLRLEFADAAQRFLQTLPLGVYLLGEDDAEPPLRIAPQDDTRFAHVACLPVTGKGLVRAVCTLGGVCSFNEGRLSGTIFPDTSAHYQELTIAAPLSKSMLATFKDGGVGDAEEQVALDERDGS